MHPNMIYYLLEYCVKGSFAGCYWILGLNQRMGGCNVQYVYFYLFVSFYLFR